ncbi:hypothetical protein FOY66_01535 [Mycoplasma capricolum subsp. capripneumoniae]|uniref:Uncharacterized protein n=1 Tax=Mycoplasma capricolum subsp. capripneumoniae 87001 TaxID=1124992 RepID=A0A9N7G8D2_MYCCC|nr:hypothetical protein [Mycoplasma capricolum]AJK51322.1 hypothetical protein MCCG_0345 [Mycoplasma capricolum subsp. capripneumoniae 87001]AOQ22021.1 hypothetical protein M1601_01540 [Mycoplasma capricolum subsp. capripneumoniae M1601]AQU77424.1 hypothetical protein BVA24_01540 [Mycoplasma capricolum subsp. capripneumoniae]QDL19504.1 hypothetical protein DQW15_01550 [Mycoplasma capricolum subsp. capripneumoniae]QDL20189.1 hypothetical protein DQW16_01550 [Mycoplasma capricolum subsp. capripn
MKEIKTILYYPQKIQERLEDDKFDLFDSITQELRDKDIIEEYLEQIYQFKPVSDFSSPELLDFLKNHNLGDFEDWIYIDKKENKLKVYEKAYVESIILADVLAELANYIAYRKEEILDFDHKEITLDKVDKKLLELE